MTQISQIAAMSLAQRPQTPSFPTTQAPPIQQILILSIQPFTGAATGSFQAGTSGGRGQGKRNRRDRRGGRGAGRGGGRNERMPFANYQQTQQEQRQQGRGRGAGGFFPQGPPGFIPQAPPGGNNPPATSLLNFVKRFANKNVCYSCRFDVKDGHTSVTCPREWQKTNHQEAFSHKNAQGYIAAGWDACTKGKHKNLFPGF